MAAAMAVSGACPEALAPCTLTRMTQEPAALGAVYDRSGKVMLLPELRSSLVELRSEPGCGRTLYWRRKADLDDHLLQALPDIQALSWRRLLGVICNPPAVIEVVEPLYVQYWPASFVIAGLSSMMARFLGRKQQVVTYAIENLPVSQVLRAERVRLRGAIVQRVMVTGWKLSSRLIDRIAFGSPLARDVYGASGLCAGAENEDFLELPAACACPPQASRSPLSTVFVGEFSFRKGIRDLMTVWPLVLQELPEAQLTLIGFGPLEREVAAFAECHRNVQVVINPPRAAVHEAFRRAQVCVLPSRRVPEWREQIGLPITEGLAHGCHIVTTSETGLAPWLLAHGHSVCEPGDSVALQREIIGALTGGTAEAPGVASLPAIGGRHEAQQWLYRVQGG